MKNLSTREIAKEIGVSAMTVSRVLKGQDGVKAATRDLVLSYLHHSAKKELSDRPGKRQRKEILIFSAEKVKPEDDFNFMLAVYFAMQDVLQRAGYEPRMVASDGADEQILRELCRCDAAVLFPNCASGVYTQLRKLSPDQKVLTLCFRTGGADSLCPDEAGGGMLAGEYLTRKGYSHLAYFSDTREEGVRERYLSFAEHCRKMRIQADPILVDDPTNNDALKMAALERYFNGRAKNDLPQAIFCTNGFLTMMLYHFLARREIRVPEQCAILGYDNFMFYRFINPPIPRVLYDFTEFGHMAANLILGRLGQTASRPPLAATFPVSLWTS